jgi:hypothetical protein
VKRLFVVLGSMLVSAAFGATLGWAARPAAASQFATISFDDAARQAQLVIPTPPCPAAQPDCQWQFVLGQPDLGTIVGEVTATSGTLTISYPPDFCGLLQADALRGPPFRVLQGAKHTIPASNCSPPVSITTTSTTTTTTTSTEPSVPPIVSGTQTQPSAPSATPPSALPFTATPAVAPTSVAPTSVSPTQLPFTGVNTKSIWLMGLTLVAFGLALIASASTWRKARHRLAVLWHSPHHGHDSNRRSGDVVSPWLARYQPRMC